MTTFSLRAPWLGALLAGSAATLAPHVAAAQNCSSDADCGEGYRCETHEYESCSGGGMCDPAGECTAEEPVCETVEYSTCSPAPCASDGDCPDRMACHQQSYWVCDGGMAGGAGGSAGAPAGSCRPDGSCEDPGSFPTPTCWQEPGESFCTPRYQLPCEVGSDCGGGFDCIESIYWVCTGMGSAGSGAGGSPGSETPPPDRDPTPPVGSGGSSAPSAGAGGSAGFGGDYECHEERSGQFYCQLQDLPCSADADCPDGLECADQYSYPPCVGTAGTGGGVGSAGAAGGSDDGMTMVPVGGWGGSYECPPPIVEQRCMPPEWYGGGTGGSGGTPGPGTGGRGGSDGGGETDPTTPPGGSAGSSTGSGGSASGSGTGNAGAGGGEASNGGDDEDGDWHIPHGRPFGWLGRGCSAGGPITADPLGWMVFGSIAWAMRRRARKLD